MLSFFGDVLYVCSANLGPSFGMTVVFRFCGCFSHPGELPKKVKWVCVCGVP